MRNKNTFEIFQNWKWQKAVYCESETTLPLCYFYLCQWDHKLVIVKKIKNKLLIVKLLKHITVIIIYKAPKSTDPIINVVNLKI